MRCRQVQRLLSVYDDGELSVRRQDRVQEHLHRCPRCRAAFAEQQAAMWLVEQDIQLVEPPPGFAQNVMAALPSRQEVRRRAQRRAHGLALGAVTTMVVVLGSLNLWLEPPPSKFSYTTKIAQSQPTPELVREIPRQRPQQVEASVQSEALKIAESPPAPHAPRLEEELIPREVFEQPRTRTGTRTKTRRPLMVRRTAPPTPRTLKRSHNPQPTTQNPKPDAVPKEPLETSPAVVVVSLGATVEQYPTAEVHTVPSPQSVQRPRLVAELSSVDMTWGFVSAVDER